MSGEETAENGAGREERRRTREIDAEISQFERASRLNDIYIKSVGKLLADAPLFTQFVIEQAVPVQGITFLAGRPESGKSWLAYDAALAVARTRPWLSFDVRAPRPGKVLILNYDNPPNELARRLRRLGFTADDKVFIHGIGSSVPPDGLPGVLRLPDCADQLVALVSYVRPDLIVLDSLRQSHFGEERSSSDMSRVMSGIRALTQFGAAVIAIHHLRKTQPGQKEEDEDPLRGSGEIEASADSIFLARNGLLKLHKARGWRPEIKECDYEITDNAEDTQTMVRSGQAYEALVSVFGESPLTRAQVQDALKLDRGSADRLLGRAIAAGIIRVVPRTSKSNYAKELYELVPRP